MALSVFRELIEKNWFDDQSPDLQIDFQSTGSISEPHEITPGEIFVGGSLLLLAGIAIGRSSKKFANQPGDILPKRPSDIPLRETSSACGARVVEKRLAKVEELLAKLYRNEITEEDFRDFFRARDHHADLIDFDPAHHDFLNGVWLRLGELITPEQLGIDDLTVITDEVKRFERHRSAITGEVHFSIGNLESAFLVLAHLLQNRTRRDVNIGHLVDQMVDHLTDLDLDLLEREIDLVQARAIDLIRNQLENIPGEASPKIQHYLHLLSDRNPFRLKDFLDQRVREINEQKRELGLEIQKIDNPLFHPATSSQFRFGLAGILDEIKDSAKLTGTLKSEATRVIAQLKNFNGNPGDDFIKRLVNFIRALEDHLASDPVRLQILHTNLNTYREGLEKLAKIDNLLQDQAQLENTLSSVDSLKRLVSFKRALSQRRHSAVMEIAR